MGRSGLSASPPARTSISIPTVRRRPYASSCANSSLWKRGYSCASERVVALPHAAADPREALLCRLVIALQIERPRVGAGSLVLVAEPLIGEAACHPGWQALRLALHRLVEIAGGGLEVIHRDM